MNISSGNHPTWLASNSAPQSSALLGDITKKTKATSNMGPLHFNRKAQLKGSSLLLGLLLVESDTWHPTSTPAHDPGQLHPPIPASAPAAPPPQVSYTPQPQQQQMTRTMAQRHENAGSLVEPCTAPAHDPSPSPSPSSTASTNISKAYNLKLANLALTLRTTIAE